MPEACNNNTIGYSQQYQNGNQYNQSTSSQIHPNHHHHQSFNENRRFVPYQDYSHSNFQISTENPYCQYQPNPTSLYAAPSPMQNSYWQQNTPQIPYISRTRNLYHHQNFHYFPQTQYRIMPPMTAQNDRWGLYYGDNNRAHSIREYSYSLKRARNNWNPWSPTFYYSSCFGGLSPQRLDTKKFDAFRGYHFTQNLQPNSPS